MPYGNTAADIERISVMAQLPGELRPRPFDSAFPNPAREFRALATRMRDPNGDVIQTKLEALRWTVETGETAPSIVRESVTRRALGHELRDRVLAFEPRDVAQRQLQESTIELIDRNAQRVNGERRDTFARNPDYAEIGRIVAGDDLIRRLDEAPLPAHASGSEAPLGW